MPATYSCRCPDAHSREPGLAGCARCGGHARPVVVWVEDPPEPDRPPPRTDPPRHAEAAALALYGRVATRRPARQRGRFHIRNIVAGALLLAIAGLTVHFDLDVALLRLVSIALAGVGLVTLLKGLLGHGPTLP